jgi:Putative transposase of IS4/5 family (DUF4096)
LEDKAAQGFLVSDELWERIKPLLPEHKNAHRFGGGRPRKDDRTCLDGILFVLRTGCQWKALSAIINRELASSDVGQVIFDLINDPLLLL